MSEHNLHPGEVASETPGSHPSSTESVPGSTASRTCHNVHPQGDVLLIVGPLERPAAIRVSSAVLRAASPVFDKMFDERSISGGRLLRRTKPAEVSLPNESPALMKTLCCILHRRKYRQVSVAPGPMLSIAKTVQRYDCLGRAVRVWTSKQLRRLIRGRAHSADCWAKILVASYLLDAPKVFGAASSELVKEWTGSEKPGLHRHKVLKLLPKVAADRLARRIERARKRV